MIVAARLFTYLGIAGTVFGLSKIHAVRYDYDFTSSSRFGASIALIVLLSISAYAVGIPDLANTWWDSLLGAAKATLTAALGVSVLQLFVGDALLPRVVVLGSPLVLIPWLGMCAVLGSHASKRAAARDQVFVVASEGTTKALSDDLVRQPERPARIVGTVVLDDLGWRAEDGSLQESVRGSGATVLVLDRKALVDESVLPDAAILHGEGVRVRSLVAFYQEWLGKIPISELERASLMFDIGELHRARYGRVKRLFDIIVGTIGLLFLLVLLPVIYVGTLLSGSKRLFFSQHRVGKGGQEFKLFKLATMRGSGGQELDHWTTLDDQRISGFGRVLRRTHLDELPQMLNILRGELSLVGPRPEQPHYVRSLSEALPYYMLRYSVTPGLTGWAQVKFGYAGSDAETFEKLQYDFYYLSNQGLKLDLLILGRTLRSVVGLEGR